MSDVNTVSVCTMLKVQTPAAAVQSQSGYPRTYFLSEDELVVKSQIDMQLCMLMQHDISAVLNEHDNEAFLRYYLSFFFPFFVARTIYASEILDLQQRFQNRILTTSSAHLVQTVIIVHNKSTKLKFIDRILSPQPLTRHVSTFAKSQCVNICF